MTSQWPHVEDVRRCLIQVFPYAVLDTIEADDLLILAVMHWHREPDYWRRRRRLGVGDLNAVPLSVTGKLDDLVSDVKRNP